MACARCVGTPMHGCAKSGSLFTLDVVDAFRHVKKPFFPWKFFFSQKNT